MGGAADDRPAAAQARSPRRFPTALSDGANGGFANWLKQTGALAFRLPAGAAEAIDRAFARDLAAKPLQLLFYNDELRARQPLYLLPEGRRETCRYLFSAAAAGQLRLEAVMVVPAGCGAGTGRRVWYRPTSSRPTGRSSSPMA